MLMMMMMGSIASRLPEVALLRLEAERRQLPVVRAAARDAGAEEPRAREQVRGHERAVRVAADREPVVGDAARAQRGDRGLGGRGEDDARRGVSRVRCISWCPWCPSRRIIIIIIMMLSVVPIPNLRRGAISTRGPRSDSSPHPPSMTLDGEAVRESFGFHGMPLDVCLGVHPQLLDVVVVLVRLALAHDRHRAAVEHLRGMTRG